MAQLLNNLNGDMPKSQINDSDKETERLANLSLKNDSESEYDSDSDGFEEIPPNGEIVHNVPEDTQKNSVVPETKQSTCSEKTKNDAPEQRKLSISPAITEAIIKQLEKDKGALRKKQQEAAKALANTKKETKPAPKETKKEELKTDAKDEKLENPYKRPPPTRKMPVYYGVGGNRDWFPNSPFVRKVMDNAPPGLHPTEEWENEQLATFAAMRTYYAHIMRKTYLWPVHVYRARVITTDMEKIIFNRCSPPVMSRVVLLSEEARLKGLELAIHSLEDVDYGDHMDKSIGQWIYALLATLPVNLEHFEVINQVGLMRFLARQCAKLRAYIDPNDKDAKKLAAPYNLFITLVTRFFRQTDMHREVLEGLQMASNVINYKQLHA